MRVRIKFVVGFFSAIQKRNKVIQLKRREPDIISVPAFNLKTKSLVYY